MALTLNNSYYLNFQSEKLTLDCNGKSAAEVKDFNLSLDFTYKKEITDLPVKKSWMDLKHNINISSLNADMSPSLLKCIFEFVNYYRRGEWLASVKQNIIGQMQER